MDDRSSVIMDVQTDPKFVGRVPLIALPDRLSVLKVVKFQLLMVPAGIPGTLRVLQYPRSSARQADHGQAVHSLAPQAS